jgi:hypothetical protein
MHSPQETFQKGYSQACSGSSADLRQAEPHHKTAGKQEIALQSKGATALKNAHVLKVYFLQIQPHFLHGGTDLKNL